ncbi:ABC transporter permease [uncultured Ilumatobacter sp.]|uniref:ABC transporter permease n=1 Tax=uncultured Ilumatobacter sp. TaxID=879968 RepID=UPI00374E833D
MLRLLIGRLLAAIPLMFLVATLVFFLAQANSVDPAGSILGLDASGEAVEAKRAELGVDRPLLTQYGDWLSNAVRGDLGTNWFNGEEVTTELKDRIPVTIALAFGGLLIAVVVGCSFGVVAGLKAGRWQDRIITVASSLGIAMPNFWIALVLAYYFAVKLGWFPAVWPPGGPEGPLEWIEALVLPSVALGVAASAAIARQTRSAMIGVLQRDYIRTALAKGLPVRRVVSRHAIRNASIPVVTLIGFQVSALLGGSLFVELIFNIPGLGSYGVDAIFRGNVPALLGFVMVIALVVVLVNIALDLSYAWLNPKVRG